jgi:RNA polymerase sigma-32 factor
MNVHSDEARGLQVPSALPDPETAVGAKELRRRRSSILSECLSILDGRERRIVDEHILSEDKHTLAEIGDELGISRERVRQLEKRALRKMRQLIEARGEDDLAPRAVA